MNTIPRCVSHLRYLSVPIAAVATIVAFATIASGQDEAEEVIELSPFSVDAGDSVGYRATSTLAGSRLKTPLKDVGSAIQVITEELFDDTGSTTMEEILPYALNMESHGLLGNFAGGPGQNHNGRFEQDSQRLNPQNAQRVRGLANASLTRGFFLTDIPFEGYNTSRIAISRGANSLLFGIGAPGGVINNSIKQANVDSPDSGEVSIRIGERDSYRGTLDVHKTLLEDRLAVRIMGLTKDTRYQQRPAFEIDQRISGGFDAILSKNEDVEWLGRTRLRLDGEWGSINGAPPLLTPPNDGFSSFFEPPNVSQLEPIPGVVVPGFYGGRGVAGDGLTETNRFHPEFGYNAWAPKQTFDNRLGLSRGNVPAIVERNFHRMKIKYNSNQTGPTPYGFYNGTPYFGAHGAAVGATGTHDADGNLVAQGPATHALGIDGNVYPVMSNNWEYIESGSFFMGNRNDQRIPNFTTPAILDPNVWDNENRMLQGLTQLRIMNFDANTYTLEQTFWQGKAGIELAYDKQRYSQESSIPFSEEETIGDSGNNDVVIDLNEYLITGDPNPNVGRPMVKTDEYPGRQFREVDRESHRATAFVNFDFEEMYGDGIAKWFGDHTLTGFYNEQTIDFFNKTEQARLRGKLFQLGDTGYFRRGTSGIRDINFRPVYEVYLGPDVRQLSSPSQVQLEPMKFTQPEIGDAYDVLMWNRDSQELEMQQVIVENVLTGGSRRRNQIETDVFSIQSRFLDNHIVGLAGWRGDTATTWENIGTAEGAALGITRDVAGRNSPRNPDYFRISENSTEASGNTFTWSVVGHIPREWLGDGPVEISAHFGESENFQVSPTRRDVRGNVIGPPSGTTEEYGVTFNLWDSKLIARLNWYETAASGATISGGTAFNFFNWISGYLGRWEEASGDFGRDADGFQAAVQASIDQLGPSAGELDNPNFQSFRDVYDEIISWLPSDIQSQRMLAIDEASGEITSEPNPGQTSTQDFVSEGFEIDLTANLTENWRFFMNVGKQEAVKSNIALPVRDVSAEIFNNIKASPIGQWADTPARSEGQTFESRFLAIVAAPLGKIAAQDGQLAGELREWRFNAVTSYSFLDGALNGFTVGGGIRWQDDNAIGYPNILNADGEVIPDLARPFLGPDQLNGDLFASYRRPIGDKIDWKVQLNIRNAFGDDDPFPIIINPDGNVAVVRNSQPQEIFLTNTFSF